MCGRYTLTNPGTIVADFLGVEEALQMQPRYNIAPTQDAPVARARGESDGRELVLLHWGLIPGWAKDPTIGNRMINARMETVADKPAFRAAFRRRRCLVAADGFYEWAKRPGGKQPFHIRRADRGPIAFAGLWEHWEKGSEGPLESFTILTTDAKGVAREIHDRMPVLLPPEDFASWLDPGLQDADELQRLLAERQRVPLEAVAVSRTVNNPANDGPDCLQPIGGEG
jgi:putative SOS response-associated peptidase YedK